MMKIETTNFIRVDKRQARKIYENNGELYLLPCNMNPENSWGMLLGPVNTWEPFDSMVNAATYYNCDSERGRYLAFYVRKEKKA